MTTKNIFISLFSIILLIGCGREKTKETETEFEPYEIEYVPQIPFISYSVKSITPHDTTLFTEGLLFYKNNLFESTGSPNLNLKSLIGITDLYTGKFVQKIEIDNTKYFGEGIVFFNDKLYQLTYKNQIGFIYNSKTYRQEGQFGYSNREGWGMTTDGENIIMSDGSDSLTYLNPTSLKSVKTLKITERGIPRDSLNELEFIKGFIYSNVWMNNSIVKIDPSNGKVVGKIDLSALTYEARTINPRSDVLNGIAYDSINDKIYVTGKLWPIIYQIEFKH